MIVFIILVNSKMISIVFYTADFKSRDRFWRIPGKSEKDNFRQDGDYTEAYKFIILITMRKKVCIPENNLLLMKRYRSGCRWRNGQQKVLQVKIRRMKGEKEK